MVQALDGHSGWRRSGILQVYHEPPETIEEIRDQAALPNLNANWVNAMGECVYGPGFMKSGQNATMDHVRVSS